ncbi:MAG: polysaccharide deacetylase family protein [Gemmatimonadota bacterium]|nr:polysaccharide deacetylase family protein [Gemmatimonadota bacterium]
MRRAIKATVEGAVVATGMARWARTRRVRDTIVLAYHNIVPAGETRTGDLSLHLPWVRFAAQLDSLAETHDVVPLDAIDSAPAEDGRRPRAIITFDDAYRGAVMAGVDELARRGMPATIFVPPAFVGGHSFWWDALTPPNESAVKPSLREHALGPLRGENTAVRRWARNQGLSEYEVPEHARCASYAELTAAANQPGITMGSHSWSHANLAMLATAELEQEIMRPLTWLRARFKAVSDYLSYPYGSTSDNVRVIASGSGYRGGLLINGGWLGENAASPFALPRLDVGAGISDRGFRLRISGLFCR